MFRKREARWVRRATAYFSMPIWDRLDSYVHQNRLELADVIEEAVTEFLDRRAPEGPKTTRPKSRDPESRAPKSRAPESRVPKSSGPQTPPRSRRS
jgi:hypothetical protein